MKALHIFTYFLLLAIGSHALAPERQVLITYPKDTPKSVLDDARSSIISAGGQILHEFELIEGFIVKASSEVLEAFNVLSSDYKPVIEDDEIVTTQE